MTKEEYISYRNNNSLEPLYNAYVEGWERGKHKFMLSFEEFINFFRMWPEAQNVYNNIMSYYDCKFEVFKVTDLRTGNIIKYY